MDWWQLILKALESLLDKEQHATKSGYDGPVTAALKAYNRCCEEMKQK